MAEGDLDGGPSNSEKRDARKRRQHLTDGGIQRLVEMAGKEPANVVSSAIVRQASADKGMDGLPRHWLSLA